MILIATQTLHYWQLSVLAAPCVYIIGYVLRAEALTRRRDREADEQE